MRAVILLFVLCHSQVGQLFAQDTAVSMKVFTYKKPGGTELKMYMFYTAASQQKKDNTGMAFFHGGGWAFGDPSEFFEACKRYARQGYICFSVQYRLCRNPNGSYPNPLITPVESTKDARSAVRWLKANAGMLRINPEKIIVGGQSAGGQLALATALLDSVNESTDNIKINPKPAALLLYSSNVNTMEAWVDMLLGERKQEIWSISPYHHVKKDMPPVILFRGDQDNQVLPYTVEMFRTKMNKMGNSYEEYIYKGKKHYLAEGNPQYATYFDEEILYKTDAFLKKLGL